VGLDPANDGDSTSLPVIVTAQQANRQRQFSEEIRLASKGRNTLDYVIGADYFWQTVKAMAPPVMAPPRRPCSSPPCPPRSRMRR